MVKIIEKQERKTCRINVVRLIVYVHGNKEDDFHDIKIKII